MKVRVILVLLFALVQNVNAQVYLDVKTTSEEKYDLTVYKHGLIQALEATEWAGIADVGENYSVWLYNFRRVRTEDSIYAAIDINLRTPAMFSRGEFIAAATITVRYPGHLLLDDNPLMEAQEVLQAIEVNNQRASSIAALVSLELDPLTGQILKAIVNSLKRSPSKAEQIECLCIGVYGTRWLQETILSN